MTDERQASLQKSQPNLVNDLSKVLDEFTNVAVKNSDKKTRQMLEQIDPESVIVDHLPSLVNTTKTAL